MVDVTKTILHVSCFGENGVETHLAKKSFLRCGDGHEPLIRKGGVYFVKAQTVNACVRADGCTEKTREYNLMGDQENRAYELMDSQKTREYNLKGAQKTAEYELVDSPKTREYNQMSAQKTDACKITSAQNVRVDRSKNRVCRPKKEKSVCQTVHVSECGRMVKLESFTTIRENVHAKMPT